MWRLFCHYCSSSLFLLVPRVCVCVGGGGGFAEDCGISWVPSLIFLLARNLALSSDALNYKYVFGLCLDSFSE